MTAPAVIHGGQPTPEQEMVMLARAMINKANQMAAGTAEFQAQVQQKISGFETILSTQVVLAPSQARDLKKAVEKRVRFHLPTEGEYRQSSKRYFQALWRDLKDAFRVAEYREIPRVRYDAAMEFVKSWYMQETSDYKKAG